MARSGRDKGCSLEYLLDINLFNEAVDEVDVKHYYMQDFELRKQVSNFQILAFYLDFLCK